METVHAGWTRRERLLLVLCAVSLAVSIAAFLGLAGGVSSAGPADLVTSQDIRNGSIKSVDIGNGKLKATDLGLYTVKSPPTLVAPGPIPGSATAVCKPGDQALSGGFSWEGHQDGLQIFSSDPSNDNSWTALGVNYGANTSALVAAAVCAND